MNERRDSFGWVTAEESEDGYPTEDIQVNNSDKSKKNNIEKTSNDEEILKIKRHKKNKCEKEINVQVVSLDKMKNKITKKVKVEKISSGEEEESLRKECFDLNNSQSSNTSLNEIKVLTADKKMKKIKTKKVKVEEISSEEEIYRNKSQYSNSLVNEVNKQIVNSDKKNKKVKSKKIKVEKISSEEEETPTKEQHDSDNTQRSNSLLNEVINMSRDFKNTPISPNQSVSQKSTTEKLNSTALVGFQEKNKLLLINYLTENSNLSQCSDISQFDLTDDEDIWLVQSPMMVDMNLLKGLNLLGKDKKKIKAAGSNYECVSLPSKGQVSLVVPPLRIRDSCKVHTYQISGSLLIREKMKNIVVEEVYGEETSNVLFPTHLKKRHPLFGVDYEDKIKISNLIKEKLTNPIKKKIKEEVETRREVKKEKKRKRTESEDIDFVQLKKIKNEPSDYEPMEISIEKRLFNVPKKSKKNKYV